MKELTRAPFHYSAGRSILSHTDPQGPLDKFAGTGQRISGIVGGPGKERVDVGRVIGQINVNGTMRGGRTI